MKAEIKEQIQKEIAKCEWRMTWVIDTHHYWMHRKAILVNCLNFGFEDEKRSIEKTLQKKHQYMAQVVKAYEDTLLDIETKWTL